MGDNIINKKTSKDQIPWRLAFMGTPDFAVPSLRAILADPRFSLQAVITQPDKKSGRKQELAVPPVKEVALTAKIPVYQPQRISDLESVLRSMGLDFIVVVAYAKIIPPSILALPSIACVNVHGSLLPRYRGASCVQAAILNGDHESGITYMLMDEGLDTGDIISQRKLSLNGRESTPLLMKDLSELAAKYLPDTLVAYAEKRNAIAQDDSLATSARSIRREDGLLDWQDGAEQIERRFRAMQTWPGLYFYIGPLEIKILAMSVSERPSGQFRPGAALVEGKRLYFAASDYFVEIESLQVAGRKPMSASDFLAGFRGKLD